MCVCVCICRRVGKGKDRWKQPRLSPPRGRAGSGKALQPCLRMRHGWLCGARRKGCRGSLVREKDWLTGEPWLPGGWHGRQGAAQQLRVQMRNSIADSPSSQSPPPRSRCPVPGARTSGQQGPVAPRAAPRAQRVGRSLVTGGSQWTLQRQRRQPPFNSTGNQKGTRMARGTHTQSR